MVTKKTMKKDEELYELLAIYPLGVNEIEAEKSLASICKKNGFLITEVDKWGVKTLAYSIGKESKGYYLRFLMKDGDTRGMENDLKIDDKILRYIIVKI